MDFKEQLAADLDIFINPDEYGGFLNIDGVDVLAVVEKREGEAEGRPGVNVSELEMWVKESDLTPPKIGQRLMINGLEYYVRSNEIDTGMQHLFLYRNVS